MTFLFVGLKVHFLVNFRLGTYNVPEGPSANPYGKARSAEFDETGWTDGWTDGTVYQKFPLIFFILCGNIEHVYITLYTK